MNVIMSIKESATTVSRRSFVVGVAKVMGFTCLFGRVLYLQVLNGRGFKKISKNNYTQIIPLIPIRGDIFDSRGKNLTSSIEYQRIVFHGKIKYDIEDLNNFFDVISLSSGIRKQILRKIHSKKHGDVVIMKNLSRQKLVKANFMLRKFKSISLQTAITRSYTHPEAYSHVLGYVGESKVDDVRANKYLSNSDVKIGKSAIEKDTDDKLLGQFGFKQVEKNAYGHVIKSAVQKEPKQGENIITTLYGELQELAHEISKDGSNASCVIEIPSGKILSIHSTPSFDANIMSLEVDQASWQKYSREKAFMNRATQGLYPPGSVFKPICAISAIRNGFDPETNFKCTGRYKLGRRYFHCWKKGGHGVIKGIEDALKNSCNTYFYNLAHHHDISNIGDISHIMGLNSIYNLPFQQSIGSVSYPTGATLGNVLNLCVGQGDLQVNCLQLAVMAGRIGSGKNVIPQIYNAPVSPLYNESLQIPSYILSFIRKGMFSVINEKGGTGYYSSYRYRKRGFDIAGKTGTAQVVSQVFENDDVKNLERAYKPHGLFVGFAPFESPRFAVAVISEHGGFGSSSALPLGIKLLNKAGEMNGLL